MVKDMEQIYRYPSSSFFAFLLRREPQSSEAWISSYWLDGEGYSAFVNEKSSALKPL